MLFRCAADGPRRPGSRARAPRREINHKLHTAKSYANASAAIARTMRPCSARRADAAGARRGSEVLRCRYDCGWMFFASAPVCVCGEFRVARLAANEMEHTGKAEAAQQQKMKSEGIIEMIAKYSKASTGHIVHMTERTEMPCIHARLTSTRHIQRWNTND